jgi:hypothetical protein
MHYWNLMDAQSEWVVPDAKIKGEVMQYTGRTDLTPPWEDTPRPDSVKLYEGDIVDAWVSRYPDSRIRGHIIWNDHAQAFQLRYATIVGGAAADFLHNWHFFKVIGNIHANPELQKETV